MKKEEIILNSECDNLDIHVSLFVPEGKIKGIVQISHGMSEHRKRYHEFMEYITNLGYITVTSDHRGHGESVRSKEDLGYFYDDTAEYVVEDLHQVTKYIKDKYPNLPVTLIGHSMGSLIARKYIKKYDIDIDKLIICGSPSQNKLVNLGIAITKTIKLFKGDKYRSEFLKNISLGNFQRNCKDKHEFAWLSPNEETLKEYEKDNLSNFTFTTNGFENVFKLMRDVYSIKNWNVCNKDLKILFISGEDDQALINKNKWHDSQNFLRNLGYINIESKLYPKFRHELLNEKNNADIYLDIVSFIEE